MNACKPLIVATATLLAGLAMGHAHAAEAAPMQVGITILRGCEARTPDGSNAADAIEVDCSPGVAYRTAVSRHPRPDAPRHASVAPGDPHSITVTTLTF